MQRRTVQLIGLACLLVSLTHFAAGRYGDLVAQGRAADHWAHEYLTTMAGAQELHHRATGRFATTSELAAGGYFGSQFASLDRAQIEGFTVTRPATSNPDHFEWHVAPKWWLWGRASHWYVDERLVLRSQLIGEAGPESAPAGAVEINWSPSQHAP